MPPEKSEHEQEKIERLRRAMYSRTLADKIKDRPRRELGEDQDQVGEDFVRREHPLQGSTVAPRAMGLARTALWWLLCGAIVFFVIAMGFFAYYFLFGGGSGSASSRNIDISVSGPPQIEGGIVTQLQVVVTNRNGVALELADLVVTYPSGTRSPADYSTSLPSQRISLGSIEAGGTRQGTVPSVLAGKEGEHAVIKVELEYRLAGSSAIFVASTDYNVIFSSSPLSVSVEGNSETVSGQPIQISTSVVSNASAPVRDVLLKADYPFGFKFTSASPAPSTSGFWELGDFSPGEKKTILIQGTLSGTQGDSRVFHFSAGTRRSAASSSLETSLSTQAFTMNISRPFLGLTVAANGATGAGVVVSPGGTVTVTINWQNNLPTAISNGSIVARLTGVEIDGASVRSSNGFYRSSDGVVLWDKNTAEELASIAPGAKGNVSFSFQMPTSDELGTKSNPILAISVNAAGNRVSENGVPETLQSTATQKITIASDLQLYAQGLYYSSPFGSVGPIPPKAGTETTYAVVFTITNTTSKITDATLSATLPPYVRWTGHWSPGSIPLSDLIFDPANNTMTWKIGTIEQGIGLNGNSPLRLAIDLGTTPSTSQIGQQPAILQNITLMGIDSSKADALRAANPGIIVVPTVLGIAKPDVTTNLVLVAQTGSGATVATDPGFSAANATVVK